MKHIPPSLAAIALAASCLAPFCKAAIKTNLERITPVAPTEQIPIADFFRPSLVHSASVNNTGSTLAAVVSDNDDKRYLFVYDIASKRATTLGGIGKMEMGGYTWIDDNMVVYNVIKDKLYTYGLFAVDTRDLSTNHPLIQACGLSVIGANDKYPSEPYVWIYSDMSAQGKDTGVHRINAKLVKGGLIDWTKADLTMNQVLDAQTWNEEHIIDSYDAPENDAMMGYHVDKDGLLAYARSQIKGVSKFNYLENGKWKLSPLNMEEVDFVTAGNEPFMVFASAPSAPGKPSALKIADVRTGEFKLTVSQDEGYDFQGYAYRDPTSKEIIGVYTNKGYPRVTWFTDSYKQIQKKLEALFPKKFIRICNSSKDQSLFVVSTESDVSPTVYHWLDLKTGAVGLLKNSRPWIDPSRMSPMRLMKFTTRDGLKLDAYLTLPAGASKTNPVPLIVLPHGGPWVRDSWGFDSEVQFLASRGYAVVQPNYRGSTGYDWMYPVEDRWDFVKMQQDVSDAASAVLATGLIDADRVAIMGASFGGYHAVAGAEEVPCKYRCAVTIAGVFDWERMMKHLKRERHSIPAYAYMSRFMGDPAKHKDKYAAISPIKHVSKIKIPMFVAHGKEDQIAEIAESKALVSALKENNVPHEVIYFAGEGHGTQNIDNTVELYERIEAFLAKNLAPRQTR